MAAATSPIALSAGPEDGRPCLLDTRSSCDSNDADLSYEGALHLIMGPMFSGKTTELMRQMRRYQVAKLRCAVVKYEKDKRYSTDKAATHDQQMCDAAPVSALAEFDERAADYAVIGIDEGQFFPDVVEYADRWASMGKTVIVAALDGTFQRKPFGRVLELVPLAESVIKLSSVCMGCHVRTAAFSKRISSETEVEVIGGSDMYLAVCRKCFHNDDLGSRPVTPEAIAIESDKVKKRFGSQGLTAMPISPALLSTSAD